MGNNHEQSSQAGLRRYLSGRYLCDIARQAAARFPLVMIFVVAMSAVSIIEVFAEFDVTEFARISLGLVLGGILSAAAVMWGEFMRRDSRLFQAAAVVVALLIYFAWERPSGYLTVATIAVYTAAASMLYFVPCFVRAGLRLSHSYTDRMIFNSVLCSFVSSALALFTFILWTTIQVLFGLESYKVFSVLLILLAQLVPSVVFLWRMPSATDDSAVPGISAPVARNFLLIPALVYMAVLYVYGLKTLVAWELPKAPIVWMVTGLVAAVFLIIFGLQGYAVDDEIKPFNKRLSKVSLRWLPMALLPLIVLMSVSIFYRIGQYGLTPTRLYVATFNIWLYGVALYLILRRRADFSPVAMSFAVIFLAVSVIPGFNYTCVNPDKSADSKPDKTLVRKEVSASAVPFKISEIPPGYETLKYEYKADYEPSERDEVRVLKFGGDVPVEVPVDSLARLDKDDFRPCLLTVRDNPSKTFLLTEYRISWQEDSATHELDKYHYVRIEGCILSK